MPVGTFYAVAAHALDAQTVRFVFSADALDFSPAGPADALNPDNYSVVVLAGAGAGDLPTPRVLKVSRVPREAAAFDLEADTPLVGGVTYRVTVARVRGETGDPLGFPDFADVDGTYVAPAAVASLTPGDFALDLLAGRVLLTPAGDIATLSPRAALRDRVVKRVLVAAGGFCHLPRYGAGFRPKRLASLASLGERRNALLAQLAEELDLRTPSVTMEARGDGIVVVGVHGESAVGEVRVFVAIGGA